MRRAAQMYAGEAKTDARDAFVIADVAPQITVTDETEAQFTMLLGFDDDPAAESTRISNRLRGLLAQIHPSLERVQGRRIQHPAVLELLDHFGSPEQLRKAETRQIAKFLKPKALRMAERLAAGIAEALTEQTVITTTEPTPRHYNAWLAAASPSYTPCSATAASTNLAPPPLDERPWGTPKGATSHK